MPKDGAGKIKIVDGRKVSYSTGQPLNVPKTGEYDAEVIRQITTAAQRLGVDPYTALAVGMQESNLGQYETENAKENWGQVNLKKWGGNPELLAELVKHKDLNPHAVALNYILKKSMDENEGSEDVKIQGYNGYLLKPNNDIGATQMYGIDLTKHLGGYDMRKDPRYGRSVIDLRDNVLRKNPSVVNYVNSLMPPKKEFAGITVSATKGDKGKMALAFTRDNKIIKTAQVDELAYSDKTKRAQLLRTALEEK